MAEHAKEQVPDALLGRVVAGKLEIRELLGRGAMGRVYRAVHLSLNKSVALKVLVPRESSREKRIARFTREAQAASRLDHPNSVQILDFGEDGDDRLLYIAMEYVTGESLRSILRREQRLDTDRACDLMVQVCAALAAAHEEGVIHRDMKPSNVLVTVKRDDDGRERELVKVCDFGVARILDDDDPLEAREKLTRPGATVGTPAFMSPEQILALPADRRSDIYSCGIILFWVVSGRLPFETKNLADLLSSHVSEPPPQIASFMPAVDPRLDQVVQRALAKAPEKRFQSAREMREALLAIRRAPLLRVPLLVTEPAAAPTELPAELGDATVTRSAELDFGSIPSLLIEPEATTRLPLPRLKLALGEPDGSASALTVPSSPHPVSPAVRMRLASSVGSSLAVERRSAPLPRSDPPPRSWTPPRPPRTLRAPVLWAGAAVLTVAAATITVSLQVDRSGATEAVPKNASQLAEERPAPEAPVVPAVPVKKVEAAVPAVKPLAEPVKAEPAPPPQPPAATKPPAAKPAKEVPVKKHRTVRARKPEYADDELLKGALRRVLTALEEVPKAQRNTKFRALEDEYFSLAARLAAGDASAEERRKLAREIATLERTIVRAYDR